MDARWMVGGVVMALGCAVARDQEPRQCDFGDVTDSCPSCERDDASAALLDQFEGLVEDLGRDDLVIEADAVSDGDHTHVRYVVQHEWYEAVESIVIQPGTAPGEIDARLMEAVEEVPAEAEVVEQAKVEAAVKSCDAGLAYDGCSGNGGDFVVRVELREAIADCEERVVEARVDARTGELVACDERVETCEDQDG